MDREEVSALLNEVFYTEMKLLEDTVGGVYRNTAKAALKSYQRTKLTEKRVCVEWNGGADAISWDSLRTKELTAMCMLDEPEHVILAVGSGTARMNPAIVELSVQNGQIEIQAWAKEGLIKQRTAEKAVNAVLSALGLVSSC